MFRFKKRRIGHPVLQPGTFRAEPKAPATVLSMPSVQPAHSLPAPAFGPTLRHSLVFRASGVLYIIACAISLVAAASYSVQQIKLPDVSQASPVPTESLPKLAFLRQVAPDPVGVLGQIARAQQRLATPIRPDYKLPAIENGLAPVVHAITTTQPVVFLTIDDGAHKDLANLAQLQNTNTKATLFLSDYFLRADPFFFRHYVTAGYPVENHSRDHILRRHQPYDIQRDQICTEADIQTKQFGRRPKLYRPPGGFFDDNTRRAAADCGMHAVIMWHAVVENGRMMYQDGDHLLPGDIVLMHFHENFPEDIAAFTAAASAAGLHTELLEDWML